MNGTFHSSVKADWGTIGSGNYLISMNSVSLLLVYCAWEKFKLEENGQSWCDQIEESNPGPRHTAAWATWFPTWKAWACSKFPLTRSHARCYAAHPPARLEHEGLSQVERADCGGKGMSGPGQQKAQKTHSQLASKTWWDKFQPAPGKIFLFSETH